jgi:hypothetical protein
VTEISNDLIFSPADAQKLWGISAGTFNTLRAANQMEMSIRKSGEFRYSGFNVLQMFRLGVQMKLTRDFKFPLPLAQKFAADASIEAEQFFVNPTQRAAGSIPYAIVPGENPRWFRGDLNMTLAEMDKKVGSTQWIVFDVAEVLAKVCSLIVEKTGNKPEFERWAKRKQAKRN